MSFGERLRLWREKLGLSQEQLADRCGSSEPAVRSYEKDRNRPSYDTIVKVCDAMLVNPDFLMQDDLIANPYEDRTQLFSDLVKLSPSSYSIVKSFVDSLKLQCDKTSTFGDRLKNSREHAGLYQEQLASACVSSAQVIRSYEKNRNRPGYNMIIQLCNVLHVNPDYLMQDDLSFNPYEERNETINDIAKLAPTEYNLVKGLVENLKNQEARK